MFGWGFLTSGSYLIRRCGARHLSSTKETNEGLSQGILKQSQKILTSQWNCALSYVKPHTTRQILSYHLKFLDQKTESLLPLLFNLNLIPLGIHMIHWVS